MPVIKEVRLFKNGTEGKVAGVGNNAEGLEDIGKCQNRSNGEFTEEGLKGRFLSVGSKKRSIFLGQEVQRIGDFGKILDETSVEIAKIEEGLDFLTVVGRGHLMIPVSLAGSMRTCPSEMMMPRYSMDVFVEKKKTFFRFSNKGRI
jgi:hypothetical protein